MRGRVARHPGFTLIEVLVALAVIAVALTAVMHNFGQSVDTAGALRERTIALWVAQNRLAMHYTVRDWPTPDVSEGTADMAGREWRWREQVAATPDADVRRVEIEVRAAAGREAAARLVGFLARPTNVP